MEMPSSPEQEQETNNELPKYERAIREFLQNYFETTLKRQEKSPYDTLDVQFDSAGKQGWGPVQSGNYEITNFMTTPDTNPGCRALHFRASGAEIHLTNKAAKKIQEMIEG